MSEVRALVERAPSKVRGLLLTPEPSRISITPPPKRSAACLKI